MVTRILEAKWTIRDPLFVPKIDYSKLSEDEQADLIIERLTNGVSKDLLEDAISFAMSKLIAEEIDNEILNSLKGTK
jgi:hypothetical protein